MLDLDQLKFIGILALIIIFVIGFAFLYNKETKVDVNVNYPNGQIITTTTILIPYLPMANGAEKSISGLTTCNQENMNKFDFTSFDAVFKCVYDPNTVEKYSWIKYHECNWDGMWAWVTFYDGYVWCTTTKHSFSYDGSQPTACSSGTCYVPPVSGSNCGSLHPESCIWYGSYSSQSSQQTTTTVAYQTVTTTTISGSKPAGQTCYQLCAMDKDCCNQYPDDCLWGGYFCQEIPS